MEWKQLNNQYLVSEKGDILNVKRNKLRKHDINKKGYKWLKLQNFNKKWLVHRLVATLFIPNPDNKPQVNHKDGNKLNNHYSNLEWCTNYENHLHSYKLGRQSPNIKLSKEQVLHIINSSVKAKELALQYNISTEAIYALRKGRNLKRLTT